MLPCSLQSLLLFLVYLLILRKGVELLFAGGRYLMIGQFKFIDGFHWFSYAVLLASPYGLLSRHQDVSLYSLDILTSQL